GGRTCVGGRACVGSRARRGAVSRPVIPIVAAGSKPAARPTAGSDLAGTAVGLVEPPPLSLYVHLPWCLRKCPYCDFNSHEFRSGDALPEQQYVDALIADLDASLPSVWGRSVQTV